MEQNEDRGFAYEDILYAKRPISRKHKPMPIEDRAAQFAAFQALSGFGAIIDDAGRMRGGRVVLTEDAKLELDRKLELLLQQSALEPEAVITYFRQSERRSGGSYVSRSGIIRSVKDEAVVLCDGSSIDLADIVDIESSIFDRAEDAEEGFYV